MISFLITKLTNLIMKLLTSSISETIINEQLQHNIEQWNKDRFTSYIDNQEELSNYQFGYAGLISKRIFCGGRAIDASDNSCEVVAVYNSLIALGDGACFTLPELFAYFCRMGICNKGCFGVYYRMLEQFYIENNYRFKMVYKLRDIDDELLEYDTYIFTSFNKANNPFAQIHTMCVEKKEGTYIVHNDYEGNKCYNSLLQAVEEYNDKKGSLISLIAVSKK